MTTKIKLNSFLPVIFLFSACNEKECLVKTIEKGKSKEIHIVKNTCKENQIVSEQEFFRMPDNNLIADGYHKEYFDNGKLHSIAFFKKNVQDSLATRYYENGNKELEFYWENGSRVGFQSTYYPNGILQRKEYFLKDSLKMFIVTYDKKGDIEKLDGPLLHITYDKNVSDLKLGERLFIINEILQLDNLESNLSVKFYSPSKRKVIDTILTSFRKFGNRYYFPKLVSFSERGEYRYKAQLKLIDKIDDKVLKEDSTDFAIIVR